MRKRRRTGLELGLYTEEREGKRAAAGVEIANDGHGTGGFDLNSRGALKGGNGKKLRREAASVLGCVFKRGIDGRSAREGGETAGRARLLRLHTKQRGTRGGRRICHAGPGWR
jgi:hypothetical protein